MFNILSKFHSQMTYWNTKLYNALCNVFPKGSHLRKQVQIHYGEGLIALWHILVSHHPAKMEQPTILIYSPPVQKSEEDLTAYYYEYVTFLFLRALIRNDSTTLTYPDKLDMFIKI